MRVSVVMTTYNGEKYILEQLESLYCQSLIPDEVLIFDDCSNDKTVEIINDFIRKNELSSWKIVVNNSNMGWKSNFVNGIDQANGDVIFPCDQDDIWHKDKIESMVNVLKEHPEINLLVGKANSFLEPSGCNDKQKSSNSMLNGLEKTDNIISSYGTKNIKKMVFNKSFKRVEQGCLMCFRKNFWDQIRIYWFPELAHDRLLEYYGKLNQCCFLYDYVVIDYRYHAGSASNPAEKTRERRLNQINTDLMEIDNLIENIGKTKGGAKEIQVLQAAKKWSLHRRKFIERRNIISGVKLIGYLSFYSKKRWYISDWSYAFVKK